MEFVCVLSCKGNLVSYQVTQDGNIYNAMLRNAETNKTPGVPVKLQIWKVSDLWKSKPEDELVKKSLVHCIESSLN